MCVYERERAGERKMALLKSETYRISLKKHQTPHSRTKAPESGNYLLVSHVFLFHLALIDIFDGKNFNWLNNLNHILKWNNSIVA